MNPVESEVRGLDKIVYLVGSAIAPTETTPSLLHHQQLQQLLFHVGRAVQMLLSQAPYRDIAIPWAPFYASDWDAADAFPAFLQFFVQKFWLDLYREMTKEYFPFKTGK
ncbi:hypothetical protein TELCIR_25147, partial [Teladorsagia circumcincta]